jgi:hypothetical protein
VELEDLKIKTRLTNEKFGEQKIPKKTPDRNRGGVRRKFRLQGEKDQ